MILWKGRPPRVSLEDYQVLRSLRIARRGSNDPSKDSVTAFARERGINPNTARSAALQGIKRYEVLG